MTSRHREMIADRAGAVEVSNAASCDVSVFGD
jgi:hypothetical protein